MLKKPKNPLDALPVRLMACLVCGLAALFYGYEFLLRAVPSVMLPELMKAFNINSAQIGMLAAFYYYAYTPMQLPVGLLMDRYGPRNLLTGMVLLCTLGAFLFANTSTLFIAEIAQLCMGFGSAFAFVGVLKLASNWLPQRLFALAAGIATALGMIGAMVSDNVLIHVVSLVGWQQTWRIAGIIGIVLAILIFFIVRNKPRGIKITKAEYTDWKHAWQGFKTVINNLQFWLNGIVGGLLFLPTTVFGAVFGLHYLTQNFGLSAQEAGFGTSMIFLGWIIGGPLVGWLSHLAGKRIPFLKGGTIITAILMTALLITPPSTPASALYLMLLLLGVFSSVEVLCFAIGCEISPKQASGMAAAATNFLIMLGGVIVPPIIGIILDLHWGGTVPNSPAVYTHINYEFAFAILPLGLLVAFVVAYFMQETYCKPIDKK